MRLANAYPLHRMARLLQATTNRRIFQKRVSLKPEENPIDRLAMNTRQWGKDGMAVLVLSPESQKSQAMKCFKQGTMDATRYVNETEGARNPDVTSCKCYVSVTRYTLKGLASSVYRLVGDKGMAGRKEFYEHTEEELKMQVCRTNNAMFYAWKFT